MLVQLYEKPEEVHRDHEVSKEERYWLWERGKAILNIGKPVKLLLVHQNLYPTNSFFPLVRFFPIVPAELSLFYGCLK